jgi:ribose/xylose/arabinose/galactoside ABC-type transport system permease subunit
MFGAIIIGELETGLVLVGAPGELYEAMIGGILIIAVLVNLRLRGLGASLEGLMAKRARS